MAEEGVFFKRPLPSLDTIDPEVSKQLGLRAALYSKSVSSGLNPNFLQQYINGNNSWVKVTSGIELESDPKAADKNILFGGTMFDKRYLRYGLNNMENEAFPDMKENSAYNFAEKEGYVPMPGITDFRVVNRGNSGYTREAQITVRCFSLEQLSILEKLYLRPGYKLLIEWGHSIYAKSNNPDPERASMEDPVYYPETISLDSLKEEDLKEKGSEIIKNSQHNYDYMLGLIKNYDWSYDRDGYTLNIEVLGKGAITTFLQEMHGGTDTEEKKGTAEDAGVEFVSSNQSTFAGILSTISQADKKGTGGNKDAVNIVEEADMDRIDAALKKKYDTSMQGIKDMISTEGDSYEFKVYRAGFADVNSKSGNKRFNYISMRTLLGMVNYFFLKRPSTGDSIPEGKFNTTPGQDKYLTYPEHFSIDPRICLLPQQTGKYGLKTLAIAGDRSEDIGDIMDIHINTQFLYETYTELRKNDKGKKIDLSVGAYLETILSKVQESLGGVNNFVLYNDFYLKKELGPSKVVDLEILPRPEGQTTNFTVINPRGKNSFVRDFSFNSTLSNSMINLIVNQAILQGVDAGKATSTATAAFNSGITSRFEADKSNEAVKKASEYEKQKEESKKKLEKEFSSIFEKLKYDQETVEKAYSNGASLIQGELDEYVGNNKKPRRGHIGAKVNLTMLGIGGLKALQYFVVPPESLPASYSEGLTVGFQITNVSHQIANQEWTTTIEANCVILSQD